MGFSFADAPGRPYDRGMADDPRTELFTALRSLLDQIADDDIPAISRIASTIASQAYLEALTRNLVDQARDQGASWDDLGQVFVTSAANVQNRFGTYRNYDDDDEEREDL